MSGVLARTERPLTGGFWEAVDRGVLVRPVCRDCGRSFFVPQFACPHCQSTRWSYEPSSGRGVVYSHTTVHRPPSEGFEAPYVIAIVDVAEGWHLMTWIVEVDPADVEIGMDVGVRFVEGADGERLPAFAPREDTT